MILFRGHPFIFNTMVFFQTYTLLAYETVTTDDTLSMHMAFFQIDTIWQIPFYRKKGYTMMMTNFEFEKNSIFENEIPKFF